MHVALNTAWQVIHGCRSTREIRQQRGFRQATNSFLAALSLLPFHTPFACHESEGSKGTSSLTSLTDIVDALQGFSHRYELEVQDRGVGSDSQVCREQVLEPSDQGFFPNQCSNTRELVSSAQERSLHGAAPTIVRCTFCVASSWFAENQRIPLKPSPGKPDSQHMGHFFIFLIWPTKLRSV